GCEKQGDSAGVDRHQFPSESPFGTIQSLALHLEEEGIDGGVYRGCVINVEQRVSVPVNVTLVDDAAGKVFLPRRIASGEDAVEVFADSHQVIIVAEVWIELLDRTIGRRLMQHEGSLRSSTRPRQFKLGHP